MTESINGEKVKVLKGFELNSGEVLLTDSTMIGLKEVRVIIEPSQLKFWIEECGLLEELGIDAAIF